MKKEPKKNPFKVDKPVVVRARMTETEAGEGFQFEKEEAESKAPKNTKLQQYTEDVYNKLSEEDDYFGLPSPSGGSKNSRYQRAGTMAKAVSEMAEEEDWECRRVATDKDGFNGFALVRFPKNGEEEEED